MPITLVIRVGPIPEPAAAPPAVGFDDGHERIRAVVDVEQRALRALEQHVSPCSSAWLSRSRVSAMRGRSGRLRCSTVSTTSSASSACGCRP